jgi:archaellum component FlaC
MGMIQEQNSKIQEYQSEKERHDKIIKGLQRDYESQSNKLNTV